MAEYHRRLAICAIGVLAFFSLLLWRLVDLQIIHASKYGRLSQVTTLKQQRIFAPRGRILDRNGVLLAHNRPSFELILNRGQIKDMERTIYTLHDLLGTDPAMLKEKVDRISSLPMRIPIAVSQDLDQDEFERLQLKMSAARTNDDPSLDLTGIEIRVAYHRVYPFKEKFGHLLGYVHEANQKELDEWEALDPGRVGLGGDVGVKGVEKTFDDLLRGHDGFDQMFVDALGREVDVSELKLGHLLEHNPASPGEDIYLTVDIRLMQASLEAFGDKVGALVAMDPRNGEVMALISQPSYNPEELTGSIRQDIWAKYRDDPRHIFLNRAVQAAYPPGSTYKIITALAALAEGKVVFDEKIHCPGYYRQGSRNWGCWKKGGHGYVNLHDALKYSCDVYFYRLGEKLGPEPIARYAKLLGLGQVTGILADYEREGIVPTAAWKRKNRQASWSPADNMGNAIGQGYNLVTPAQLALMMAEFASGGKKLTPHLLLSSVDLQGVHKKFNVPDAAHIPLDLSPGQYQFIKQALVDVVNGVGGTGGRAKLEHVQVAGKTGTAQVIGHDSVGKVAKGVRTGDHALFVAFAPAENPEIALAVVVEHGGGGGAVAAPIAKKVLEAYFTDEKN